MPRKKGLLGAAKDLTTPIRSTPHSFDGQGGLGFDNPRDNIDPHVKTKVVSTKEIEGQSITVNGNYGNNVFIDGIVLKKNSVITNKGVIYHTDDGTNGDLNIWSDGAVNRVRIHAADNFGAASLRATFDYDGHIGFHIDNPLVPFHLVGNQKIDDGSLEINRTAAAANSRFLIIKDGDSKTLTIQKLAAGEANIVNNEGAINIKPSNDTNDYFSFATSGGDPTLTMIGNGATVNVTITEQSDGNLNITPSGGVLITTGSIQATINMTCVDMNCEDIYFTATGKGLAYGGIWVNGNGLATAFPGGPGVPAQFVFFAANEVANRTTPAFGTNDITIDEAGDYKVTCSIHCSSLGGAGVLASFDVMTNGGTVPFGNLHSHRWLAGGAVDNGSVSLSGIITLAAADTLELWLTDLTAGVGFTVDDATLSVVKVGG